MRDPNALQLALASRTLCCNVRTAAVAFITYYMVSTLLVCADMAVWAVDGNDLGGFIHCENLTRGQQIFDTTTNFLLLIMIVISCIFALFGLRKGCAKQLLPFLIQVYLDLGLSVMSLFSGPWGLPGTPTLEETNSLVAYFTEGKKLAAEETARITLIFGVLFVLYLLMKVYAAHIVTKCYYVMRLPVDNQDSLDVEKSVSVKLPSYDEALNLSSKPPSPDYQLL